MDLKNGFIIILFVCLLVILILSFRNKMDFVLNFIVRGIFGMLGVFFINQLLLIQGIGMEAGLNFFTFLTSGILGFPGLIVIYGILMSKFL